jgi:hypothetical protein
MLGGNTQRKEESTKLSLGKFDLSPCDFDSFSHSYETQAFYSTLLHNVIQINPDPMILYRKLDGAIICGKTNIHPLRFAKFRQCMVCLAPPFEKRIFPIRAGRNENSR